MTANTLNDLGCTEAIGIDSLFFRATRYGAISQELIAKHYSELMQTTRLRVLKTQALSVELYNAIKSSLTETYSLNTGRILSARYYTDEYGFAHQIIVRSDNADVIYIDEQPMTKYEARSFVFSAFEDVDKRHEVVSMVDSALSEAATLYEPQSNTLYALGWFLAGVAVGVAGFFIL